MTDFERLTSNVIPTNYKITVQPDFDTYKFNGYVVIDLNIKTKSEKIVLNSEDISFVSAIYELEGVRQKCKNIEVLEEQDLVVISFRPAIKIGNGKLSIRYTGTLNDDMRGFYRAEYNNENTQEQYSATTQFQATSARRAFPCFDEPAFKATFDVIIIAEANKTVLSNMPLKDLQAYEDDEKLRKFIFEKTPIMSTYLVAFVIGEYDSISSKLHNGASIKVYTPLEKESLGEFALEIATKTVKIFSDLFDIEYPLPKLDLIAVPNNPAEGMENWGLIICDEANMLLDKNDHTYQQKIDVAYIIAHEVAHQWFGNLVTMEWWSDLWLNEGFATWAGVFSIDDCLPNHDIWTNFYAEHITDAFKCDSLVNTHPIEAEINNPDEIDGMFDSISYEKGACVVRMLREYIGESAFRIGLHNYLEEFKYSNATTEHLCAHFSKSSKKPVADFLKNWTQKGGYPCVKVERSFNDNEEMLLTLTQNQFFANGVSSTDDLTIWKIPITVSTASSYPSVKQSFLFDTRTATFNLGNVETSEWILLNSNGFSYHRTHYQSSELIDLLKNNLQKLNSCDRLILQNDAFALAQAGQIDMTELLDILKFYENEENANVWKCIRANIFNLSQLLVNTEHFEDFRQFVIKLCKPISLKLGWEIQENEDLMVSACKDAIYLLLIVMSDEETWQTAIEIFADSKKGNPIPTALKESVFTAVLLNGSEDELEEFLQLYEDSDDVEETTQLLRALSFVKDPAKIEQLLDFAYTKTSEDDMINFINDISRNPCCKESTQLVWDSFKKNYSIISKRYENTNSLGDLIKPIIENFSSFEVIEDIKAFVSENSETDDDKQILQGLEQIVVRSMWLSKLNEESFSFSI